MQLGCLLGGEQSKQTHGQLKLETWLPKGQISRKVSVEHCVCTFYLQFFSEFLYLFCLRRTSLKTTQCDGSFLNKDYYHDYYYYNSVNCDRPGECSPEDCLR